MAVALATAFAIVVAACSTQAGASPSAPPDSAPSGALTRVEVTLTDGLKIEPADMVVAAGTPITFVITNSGVLDHEFYLGDEAAQMAHGEDMAGGGMAHGEPMGISVKPGETMEFVTTIMEPGQLLAGCHVNGHYEGGMKATVTVTEG